ncbi:Uncharacterized protein dnm_100200 [Desulfonema magnum]|uniref:Uncharacterized protein n=1 Tax=Desulfonema magnum TaxID=45655 RepID=A0A975GUJ9_9BACT|nr:Uncharacterized protein dnm_100200 [Desulfonema magnum]
MHSGYARNFSGCYKYVALTGPGRYSPISVMIRLFVRTGSKNLIIR